MVISGSFHFLFPAENQQEMEASQNGDLVLLGILKGCNNVGDTCI